MKLKHSLNKRLELRRAVTQKGPKIGRRPLWDDQSAETRARRESSRRDDRTHRRADPIVLVSPILGQGVNAAAAEGDKFRIESRNLGLVMRRKSIDCVRAPFGVNHSKYRRVDGPVIFVNKSAEKICSFIKRPWDPLRFQLLTKQRLKMSIARAWRLILELPIATILAAP